MIQHVLHGWDTDRQLGTLNKADLRKLAVAAISGYVVGKSKWDKEFSASGRLSSVPFADPN